MNADWWSLPFAGQGQATTIAPTEPPARGPFSKARRKGQRAAPKPVREPMGFRVPGPSNKERST
jgi:hypothetical protein